MIHFFNKIIAKAAMVVEVRRSTREKAIGKKRIGRSAIIVNEYTHSRQADYQVPQQLTQ